jgi:hypothetical protein
MLPVLVGTYDAAEDRTHAERVTPPMPDLAAILAAPFGYGDTGFRQQGEYDVLRVTEEVQRAYRVDAQRTYLTGLSMGGIGAAGVSLHRPDVYAAAAPLCGYHSYFVRGDTRGVRRPWETFLMELRSNDHWAENGLHLPMYIVQGTRDRPLSNSQTLADRYTALGYRLEVEWPDLGHDVWSTTYAGGRIVPHFLRFSRDEAPPHPPLSHPRPPVEPLGLAHPRRPQPRRRRHGPHGPLGRGRALRRAQRQRPRRHPRRRGPHAASSGLPRRSWRERTHPRPRRRPRRAPPRPRDLPRAPRGPLGNRDAPRRTRRRRAARGV